MSTEMNDFEKRTFEGYLLDGAIHKFKEVRVGLPLQSELYVVGGGVNLARVFMADKDWKENSSSCMIVELCD